MRLITTLILLLTVSSGLSARTFDYHFHSTPVASALSAIIEEHPDLKVSFIYDELEKYVTSARVDADDPYMAIRQAVGKNPVMVSRDGEHIFVEAMQHGVYRYSGRLVTPAGAPIDAATVMLLSPADSTVLTYGISDERGRFSIPCDSHPIIAKISCLGYMTTLRTASSFNMGVITLEPLAIRLKGVSVSGEYASNLPDRTVFIPTQRQKNTSQTGIDLLNRMSIPQLRLSTGESVETAAGKPVDIYIDYSPASFHDLAGMRMADVRRVEYYDYPADPRFQGKPHVINFIMTQYEYGGYVKAYGNETFITNKGEASAYAKFQYRRMTYDLAFGASYLDNGHSYEETAETYRLPQTDGTVKSFDRYSSVDWADKRSDSYWVTAKAQYQNDNVTLNNLVGLDFDHTGHNDLSGTVGYTPDEYPTARYNSDISNRINSFAYSGYWYFKLPRANTLTVNSRYNYSHTSHRSLYQEDGETFINNARDDSHKATVELAFNHTFDQWGTLKAFGQGILVSNRTFYTGTSNTDDHAITSRIGPCLTYSITKGNFYGLAGVGYNWDRSEYGKIVETTGAPWIDLALRYSFSRRHAVSTEFHYHKSIPSSSYRSASVIVANPLMSYTGNPSLVPYNSYDYGVFYNFFPTKMLSFGLYGFGWIVNDRYAYVYEGSPTGILRTIQQPMGLYAQGTYGVSATARLLDGNLTLGGRLQCVTAHNGKPYNWNRAALICALQGYYYIGDFYLGAEYTSPFSYPDGCMVGTWMRDASNYSIHGGWANSEWNVKLVVKNFARWNWLCDTSVMESEYYDLRRYIYGDFRHCAVQLSATYTFGFGRKITRGNEASQQSGINSGILK